MTIAIISHPDCLLHDMGFDHPEQPRRLRAIETEFVREGLDPYLKHYQAPLATREQVLRVHDENYVDQIFNLAPKEGVISLDPDTWMNPYTLSAALRAAGANVYAVDLIMKNEIHAAFCNVRPPGHHAEYARAMGFCFFNNIAVGVAHALDHYKLDRVAIIDFDVHHGNGTEDIFRNEERVLLCSSFQHPFYPGSGAETISDHILNMPLEAGTTGKSYREHVIEYWIPKVIEFQPDMIFFSAGFDAHAQDPLANLLFTEDDYAWITYQFKQIANKYSKGRMVSTLEGGYDLDALGASAAAHVKALM